MNAANLSSTSEALAKVTLARSTAAHLSNPDGSEISNWVASGFTAAPA